MKIMKFTKMLSVFVLTLATHLPMSVNTMAAIPIDHNSGVDNQSINEIARLYELAADDLVKYLGVALDTDTNSEQYKRARASTLLQQINQRLTLFSRDLQPKIYAASVDSYKLGIHQGVTMLSNIRGFRISKDSKFSGSFNLIDHQAVELIAKDIQAKSLTAMSEHAANVKTFLRTIQSRDITDVDLSRKIAKGIITGNPQAAMKEVRQLFKKPGIEETYRQLGQRQITVGQRTMSVKYYSELLVRTRTREAVCQARHGRFEIAGVDLVKINGKVSENFCTRFIGLVCSLSGKDQRWPALASLPGGGPPFHPFCTKGTRPYIPHLASDSDQDAANKALRVWGRHRNSKQKLTDDQQSAARSRL